MGLFDLHFVSGDEKVKKMYSTGIKTLKSMIPDWILLYWSKYDLFDITSDKIPNLATQHYQCLHVDQAEILYLQTNDPFFLNLKVKLEKQLSNPFNLIRIYANKFQKLILKM